MTQGLEQSDPMDRLALVKEHWPEVYRLCYRLSGNAHDAEEITQESFLRALEKWHRFEPGTNLRAWLFRIATNAFLTIKRRARTTPMGDAMYEVAGNQGQVEAGITQGELSNQLQAAILRLSDTQRTVFVLRATEDVPFSEISAILGITETTVRWHMSQARQQLVKLLEGKL